MGYKNVVICDLDNTLYDWVSYFVPSIVAMSCKASEILQVSVDVILDDLRDIHLKHNTVEKPFALLDTSVVHERLAGLNILERKKILDPAFHEFNKVRKEKLKLYPGVLPTLEFFQETGIPVVAFSDSNSIVVEDRIRKLGLEKHFSYAYASSVTTTEPTIIRQKFRDQTSIVRSVHETMKKPSIDVLKEVSKIFSVKMKDLIVVGDSKVKDIRMANNAGAYAIWASYGDRWDRSLLTVLQSVSHWSEKDIKEDQELRENMKNVPVQVDFELTESFEQIRSLFRMTNSGKFEICERRVIAAV